MTGNGTPSRADLHALFSELHNRGLSHGQIADHTGYKKSRIMSVLADPDGSKQRQSAKRTRQRESFINRFERNDIFQGLILPPQPAPPEPARDQEFDVSGEDGIRYTVIPIGLPPRLGENDSRPGWTVFDTMFKARVGLLRTDFARAWRDCRYFNAHDKLEEDAA